MSGKHRITDHILALRKDIAKRITEKMTVKEAWLMLSDHDIVYNSFYQQCKLMVDLGYLQSFGYEKSGRAHCLIIQSIKHEYEYAAHTVVDFVPRGKKKIKDDAPVVVVSTGKPRVFSADTDHWYREKKKLGRNYVSGASLSAVMMTASF